MAAGQSSARAFENIMASMFYMLISAVPAGRKTLYIHPHRHPGTPTAAAY